MCDWLEISSSDKNKQESNQLSMAESQKPNKAATHIMSPPNRCFVLLSDISRQCDYVITTGNQEIIICNKSAKVTSYYDIFYCNNVI